VVFPIASQFFAKCLGSCAGSRLFPVGFQSFTRLPLFDAKCQLPLVQTKCAKKAKDRVELGAFR
jgi:hypothetical protein